MDKYGRSVTQSSSAIGARTLYGSYSGTESTGARSLYGSYSGNEGNGGNNNGIGGYVGYGGVYGSHSGNGETQWVTQTLSPGVPRVVSQVAPVPSALRGAQAYAERDVRHVRSDEEVPSGMRAWMTPEKQDLIMVGVLLAACCACYMSYSAGKQAGARDVLNEQKAQILPSPFSSGCVW